MTSIVLIRLNVQFRSMKSQKKRKMSTVTSLEPEKTSVPSARLKIFPSALHFFCL